MVNPDPVAKYLRKKINMVQNHPNYTLLIPCQLWKQVGKSWLDSPWEKGKIDSIIICL